MKTMIKAINGEKLTRDSAIDRHKNLVHFISRKFLPRAKTLELEYDDIVSMGFIGLIIAIDTFDPKYNLRFSTYAYTVIENTIKKELRYMHDGIRYSRKIVGIALKIEQKELINRPVEEIAKILKENEKNITFAIKYLTQRKPSSINQAIYIDDNEDLEFGDMVGADDDFTTVYVDEFLAALNKQERRIIELLMDGYSQYYIGKKLGISQAHVSRIKKRIQKKYLK